MGSSRKRKPQGQAEVAMGSGESVDAGDNEAPAATETLTVPLVNVHPDVHNQSAEGDRVVLHDRVELEVHVSTGRLGDVPAYLRPAAKRFGAGYVAQLSASPPSATVVLH